MILSDTTTLPSAVYIVDLRVCHRLTCLASSQGVLTLSLTSLTPLTMA